MRIQRNPLLWREMRKYAGTKRLTGALAAYEIFLALVSAAGFGTVLQMDWGNAVEYSGVAYLYMILAGLQSMAVILMVPFFSAQSIAAEWENQTMELLVVTAMRPFDIVAGKLFSAICVSLLFVIAGLPFLAIIFTLGGVGKVHLLQFVFVLWVEAVFVGSIGVYLSSIFRKTDIAGLWSYMLSLLLCLGNVVLGGGVYLVRRLGGAAAAEAQGGILTVVLLLLLLNPLVTVAALLTGQLGYTQEFCRLLRVLGPVPEWLLQHWCGVGVGLQLTAAVVLLILSARLLKSY